MDCRRSRRVLLEGWGQFDEPADRIVSIGAFEHFGHERYAAVSPMLSRSARFGTLSRTQARKASAS